jgi:hypothetical protein
MTTRKAICIAMLIGGSALAEEHALDGHTYAVEYKEKGGLLPSKDLLLFRNGRFRSTDCDSYGFGDAGYGGNARGFSAETASAKEGRIAWQGAIAGDQIEGTFVWSRPGKSPIEYTFKGSATPAAPPKGLDQKSVREHLTKHQSYPATKSALIASCNNLMDFSADDKKWFSESLPDRTYASAADVMKVLGVK